MPRPLGAALGLAILAVIFLAIRFAPNQTTVRSPAPAMAPRPTSPILPPREGDRFVDVTADAGLDFVHMLVDGEMSNVVENLGSGAAVLDIDGDGWLDVYFAQGSWSEGVVEGDRPDPLPTNRLYRNRGDGTFEDVTAGSGTDDTSFTLAVVAADADGDGFTDLYLCNAGANRLLRNRGDGTFEDVTRTAGVGDAAMSAGATFADLDGDEDLDLYVTNYVAFDPDYDYFYGPDGFPPPVAYEPQRDTFYRNRGDGTFEDATVASGIAEGTGRGMSVVATDFDDNGAADLFVANDGTANFLWLNRGDGTFTDDAIVAGVAFGENGEATGAMTADIGDVDADGVLDVFVTDTAFSSMYRAAAPGAFVDRVVDSGLALLTGQYVSWGGGFVDFDADTHLDLFVVNGDLHHVVGWEDLLLHNDGAGNFADAAASGVYFGQKLSGRGGAVLDYDNDGDPDLLVTNMADRVVLLRNDARPDEHWLTVSLRADGGNRDGYGARVLVHAGDRTLTYAVRCPTSYLCGSDPRLHVGLGAHDRADSVEVTWPDGRRQVVVDAPASSPLVITRPERSS